MKRTSASSTKPFERLLRARAGASSDGEGAAAAAVVARSPSTRTSRVHQDLAYEQPVAAAASSPPLSFALAPATSGAAAAAADSSSSSAAALYPGSPSRSSSSVARMLSPSAAVISPGRRVPTFDSSVESSASSSSIGNGGISSGGSGSSSSTAAAKGSGSGPPHWREQLANIERMRSRRDAPVDTMGCERCADPAAPPALQRYQILLSLMLSSQTKDEVTFAAMQRLVAHGCTPANIAATPPETLEQLIHPVGFYRNKAKFIIEASRTLLADFGGDIPNTAEGLMKLKGVGPKMAHIAMHAAWGKMEGLGVDVHVHRISNRLGWAKSSSPEGTRAELEAWLPREHWSTFNLLLVGFGQQVCQAADPACSVCLNRDTCMTGKKHKA